MGTPRRKAKQWKVKKTTKNLFVYVHEFDYKTVMGLLVYRDRKLLHTAQQHSRSLQTNTKARLHLRSTAICRRISMRAHALDRKTGQNGSSSSLGKSSALDPSHAKRSQSPLCGSGQLQQKRTMQPLRSDSGHRMFWGDFLGTCICCKDLSIYSRM